MIQPICTEHFGNIHLEKAEMHDSSTSETIVTWNGKPVTLYTHARNSDAIEELTEMLQTAGQNQALLTTICDNALADELLDVYNTSWRAKSDEGKQSKPVLNKEEFLNKVSLMQVLVYPSNQIELGYDNDGLFGGNYLSATIDLSTHETETEMVG